MTLQDSKKSDTGKYFSSSQVVNMKRWKFKKYSKKKKNCKTIISPELFSSERNVSLEFQASMSFKHPDCLKPKSTGK